MTAQTMFTPNGDGYDISPAGVLLLVADTIYGPSHETTPQGIRNARSFMDDTLAAARAGGFMQNDILRTLLAKHKMSPRIMALAQEAVDAAGDEAMHEVFAKHRM